MGEYEVVMRGVGSNFNRVIWLDLYVKVISEQTLKGGKDMWVSGGKVFQAKRGISAKAPRLCVQ